MRKGHKKTRSIIWQRMPRSTSRYLLQSETGEMHVLLEKKANTTKKDSHLFGSVFGSKGEKQKASVFRSLTNRIPSTKRFVFQLRRNMIRFVESDAKQKEGQRSSSSLSRFPSAPSPNLHGRYAKRKDEADAKNRKGNEIR